MHYTKYNKMSKRCKLQKEYYKEFGNYKGDGKYSDHYVKWLENEVLALRLYNVVGQSEQYFCEYEEVGYNKRCKQQCSDCNWIENL